MPITFERPNVEVTFGGGGGGGGCRDIYLLSQFDCLREHVSICEFSVFRLQQSESPP